MGSDLYGRIFFLQKKRENSFGAFSFFYSQDDFHNGRQKFSFDGVLLAELLGRSFVGFAELPKGFARIGVAE